MFMLTRGNILFVGSVRGGSFQGSDNFRNRRGGARARYNTRGGGRGGVRGGNFRLVNIDNQACNDWFIF